jgi:glycosyltransferase involved in cell wall biosynthesis
MRPLYNLDKIATAADAVCTAVPQAYFVFAVLPVATDEAYEAKVREILSNGAARDRVRFVGAISHEQMPDYYRLADVMISIPSRDGTPMSVLESMASGTPVLVSRIPNYDSQYIEDGKTVLMADWRYAGVVATALIKLLQDHSLAQRIAAEAKRRVTASASYESQMAKMDQLYQTLISHR